MSIVNGMLFINGVVELGFGLCALLMPSCALLQLIDPFAHNSYSSKLWAIAIIGLGASCLNALYLSKKLLDHRHAASPLLGMIFYHIGVIYIAISAFLQDEPNFHDENLLHDIILPYFNIKLGEFGPIEILVNTLGVHAGLLFLTLIAWCLAMPEKLQPPPPLPASYPPRFVNSSKKSNNNKVCDDIEFNSETAPVILNKEEGVNTIIFDQNGKSKIE